MNVVHSSIADCGNWSRVNEKGQLKNHAAIKLWYYLRAIDSEGVGRAELNILEAAQTFERSTYTIRRWCVWGMQLGIFRSVTRIGVGKFRVYYAGLRAVAKISGISDLGACPRVEVEDLKNLKAITTEAETQQLQKQSQYAQIKKEKSDPKKVPTALELTTPCDLGAWGILSIRGRFTFLKSGFHPHGGSQSTIARRQGRHKSTVQRRLSDTWREKHGLDPIPKTQLLAAPRYHARIMSDGEPKRLVKGQVLTQGPGRQLYRCCPNVYRLDHELVPLRHRRGELKRMRNEQGERWTLTEDWKLNPEYQALKEQWQEVAPKPIRLTYRTQRHRRRRVGIKKTN